LDKHGNGVPPFLFGNIERFICVINDTLDACNIFIFSNDA